MGWMALLYAKRQTMVGSEIILPLFGVLMFYKDGGDGGESKVAVQEEPSGQGLWLARVKTCDQPTQGSSLRDQVGGEIRPSRRGRRVGVANGAYLACLPGHRHLVWCLGNGGCPDLERANSDPGRRAGRSCDQKQVARTFVRGGPERWRRVSETGRRALERDRPLSGFDQ